MPGFSVGYDGVKFPATQVPSSDPNTFDDYEESNHTATATPSGSGTVTLSSSTLKVTKKGREVTVSGLLVVSGVSTPVGALNISLPVACAAGNSSASPASVTVNGATAGFTGVPCGAVLPGTSMLTLLEFAAGATGSTFANRMQAATEVYVCVTYPTV